MSDRINEEITYLKTIVADVTYNTDMFTVSYGDGDKVIMGAIGSSQPFGRLFEYKTIFDTVIDVDWKIKKSLLEAIDYAYKDDLAGFNPFNSAHPATANEREAIYYTENAVFRTSIEWDMLAQLYNVKYGIEADIRKIHHKSFFMNKLKVTDATIIASYFEQEDNTDVEPWQGNYTYVNHYRNQMTHRNSPNVTTISNFDFKMRMPMQYVLKRVVEDYSVVSSFINAFLNNLTDEDFQ